MKRFPFWVLMLLLTACCNNLLAQTLPVPTNLPVKPKPTTPTKFKVGQPDLQVVSVNVTGVEEQTDHSQVRITLSVTYKNAGNTATGATIDLELLCFQASQHSGATSISSYPVGFNTGLPALNAGESRTVDWSFVRNKSPLTKNGNRCSVAIDSDHRIAESNENNNQSSLFTITIP